MKEAIEMTNQEKMYRDWCEAFNVHQVDKVLSFVADDIVRARVSPCEAFPRSNCMVGR